MQNDQGKKYLKRDWTTKKVFAKTVFVYATKYARKKWAKVLI